MTPKSLLASTLLLAAPAAARAGDLGETLIAVGVPAIIFGFVLAIVLGAFYSGYRQTRERQETLRLAIEKGAAIPPGMFDEGRPDPTRDLRRGIRLVFVGIGVGVMLWYLVPHRGVWAVGLMIVIFGLGNLIAWAVTRRMAPPPPPPAA